MAPAFAVLSAGGAPITDAGAGGTQRRVLAHTDRRADRTDMPVISLNDQKISLQPGQTRLGPGPDADVRVGNDPTGGVQAILERGRDDKVVIRRAGSALVRVNGVQLVDPTPLMHGDKVEIAGQ